MFKRLVNAVRKGIKTLSGLLSSGGINVPPPNPPVPTVPPPASQQTVNPGIAVNAQTVFAPTVTRSSTTQNTSLPVVTNPPTVLTPTVLGSTFNEPFTGTSGPPGPLWTTADMSSGSGVVLNNNQLLMFGGSIGSNLDYQYLPSDWTVNNFNLRVDIILSATVTDPHYVHVGFRGSGTQQSVSGQKGVQTTGYFAEIGVGEHYAKLGKCVVGSTSTLGQVTIAAFAANDVVHMRVIGNGTSLKLWIWRNSETEPLDPIVNVADSSYASGKIWLGHTGGVNTSSDSVRFDNMTIDGAVTTPPPPVTTTTKAHWGYSITQDSMLNFPNARGATAQAVMASIPNNIVNVHVGGFGIYPPEYINNTFDWTGDAQGVSANGLDDGVDLVRAMVNATNGVKMITLCTAPGWMKASGNTFSMDEAPTDAMEQEWANSCAAIAARYTDVIYFQFWNEFKGLYNGTLNRWNYEKYTRMYNLAWTAIKAVRPDAKIGGPYIVFSSWSSGAPGPALGAPRCTFTGGEIDGRALDVHTYFKANALGYDFICVDAWVGNQFGTTLGAGVTNQQQLDKFIKIMQWVRTNHHATKLIVCSEFYPQATATAEDTVGDYVIEVLNRTTAEVSIGDGIWYLQWGESAEPPRPFNYSTGVELPYVMPKLRTYEATTTPTQADMLAFFYATYPCAATQTVWVDKQLGNDANTGTAVSPKATIQGGVNIASAGTRVMVRSAPTSYAGFTFTGHNGTTSNWIQVVGESGAKIQGAGQGTGIINLGAATFCAVYGFEVIGLNGSSGGLQYEVGAYMDSGGHSFAVQSCHIHHCSGHAFAANGGARFDFNYNYVHDLAHYNEFQASAISAIGMPNSGTAWADGYKNHIMGNVGHAIWQEGASVGGDANITDGNFVIIDTSPGYTGRTLIAFNLCAGIGGRGIHTLDADHVDAYCNTATDTCLVLPGTWLGAFSITDATDCNFKYNVGAAKPGSERVGIYQNAGTSVWSDTVFLRGVGGTEANDPAVGSNNNVNKTATGPTGYFQQYQAGVTKGSTITNIAGFRPTTAQVAKFTPSAPERALLLPWPDALGFYRPSTGQWAYGAFEAT